MKSRRGFTLIELLTSIAVLVIVFGLMVSLSNFVRNTSATDLTTSLLRKLDDQLDQYSRRYHGQFPPVPAFDPRFLGLRGDAAATEKVAKEFKVFYQKVPGKEPGSYTMDHTAGIYVFDPQGRIRLFMRNAQDTESVVHDLKLLLQ